MNVLVVSGGRLRSHDVLDAFQGLATDAVELSLVTWAAPTQTLLDAVTASVVHGDLAILTDVNDDTGERKEPTARTEAPATIAGGPPTPWNRTPAQIRAGVIRRLKPVADRLPERVRKVVWDGVVTQGQHQRSAQLWRASRRSPDVDQLATDADMIVAVDIEALRTTWWLGRRNRSAELVLGLGSAAALLNDRMAQK